MLMQQQKNVTWIYENINNDKESLFIILFCIIFFVIS